MNKEDPDPDINRPGYSRIGKWIGYEEWGRKMDSRGGLGAGIVLLIIIIGIGILAYNSNGNSAIKDGINSTDSFLSRTFFPDKHKIVEIDSIHTKKGENWIIKSFSNHSTNWRQKLADSINRKLYDINSILERKEWQNFQLKNWNKSLNEYNTSIELIYEAKRVIEDGQVYPNK